MIDPYEVMASRGISLRERSIQQRQAGRMTTNGIGGRMLREGAAPVLFALKKWMRGGGSTSNGSGPRRRTVQLVEAVGVEVCVAKTMQYLIDITASGSVQDCGVGRLRVHLGRQLAEEAAWRNFRDKDSVGFSYRIKDYQRATGASKAALHRNMEARMSASGSPLDWDSADRNLIAALLIDLAVKSSGIFQVARALSTGRGKRDTVLLSQPVQEWIAKGEDLLGYLPRYLPIAEKPLPWGPGLIGGYDAQRIAPLSMMSGNSPVQRKALEASDCASVYSAVNHLQNTAWRVNEGSLDLLLHATENGWSEAGIPADPGDPPRTPETDFDKKAPEWTEHFRRKRAWHIAHHDFRAVASEVGRTLALARDYSTLPHFFMPHRIDFRGRCYPSGAQLGYQGSDFQRSMTKFAVGRPVGEGLGWFLTTGSNLFGNDKCSLEDRQAWTRTNSEELIAVGNDPKRHRMWMEADKPFQFAAWCAEFAKMQHEGESFLSHLPIGVDGSSNGLQCYSLLLRDAVGGRATNCVSGDLPSDIYQIVADKATAIIRETAKTGDDPRKRRWCKQILAFCERQGLNGLPRKATKRPTMVLPYGGTLYSCQGYLSEWYTDYVRGQNIPESEHPFPQRDVFQALNFLGEVVWAALGAVVVKAREAMDWLHVVADIVSGNNQHVRWTTPLGLKCSQSYVKGKSRRVTLMTGSRLEIQAWEPTETVDSRKARNGFAPNYIHSLDASAMMHTTNLLAQQGIEEVRMIHDDFATHASNVETLSKTLRYAYLDIFRHPLLETLQQELQSQTPEDEIPLPPAAGTLQLDQLLKSTYFFA